MNHLSQKHAMWFSTNFLHNREGLYQHIYHNYCHFIFTIFQIFPMVYILNMLAHLILYQVDKSLYHFTLEEMWTYRDEVTLLLL